jgi:hypothetical protein
MAARPIRLVFDTPIFRPQPVQRTGVKSLPRGFYQFGFDVVMDVRGLSQRKRLTLSMAEFVTMGIQDVKQVHDFFMVEVDDHASIVARSAPLPCLRK